MGTAEASEGIIHYLPKEILSGVVINMQTMYMAILKLLPRTVLLVRRFIWISPV